MDKVFTQPIKKQFEFDASVASVFDDMASRSIPFYKENLLLISKLLSQVLKKDAHVVDLGCSTANMLFMLERHSPKFSLVGYDNAKAMLEIATSKAQAYGSKVELLYGDITALDLSNCDAIISNYTLQFIRPPIRKSVVKNIYNWLNNEGIFIFSEKIIYEDKELNKSMIDIYLDFKRTQGYSDFEIYQKREALENVLVPYTEDENRSEERRVGKEC